MKWKTITIDECMSMSKKELNEFIDNDKRMLAEGLIDESQPNVDLKGMSDYEIAQKYGFKPINVVYDKIMEKISKLT